jgi:hypothetical protein
VDGPARVRGGMRIQRGFCGSGAGQPAASGPEAASLSLGVC